MQHSFSFALFFAIAFACGCGGSLPSTEESDVVAADELEQTAPQRFSDGALVEASVNVNLRAGPGTDYAILRTIPAGSAVEITHAAPEGSFVAVRQSGLDGYVAERYLRARPAIGVTRERILQVAQGEVGLSYWSGHARLTGGAVTAANRGSCSSAGHRGAYGTDCAGLLAKAWEVPASNQSLTHDQHPYVSGDFYNGTGGGQWAPVSKSEVQPGDALVYRQNGSGYATIYERGDAWGEAWVYEARGCAEGVVHDIRNTGGASYRALRRRDL